MGVCRVGVVVRQIQNMFRMLVACYRKWATIRLVSMEGWVAEWAMEHMYVGTGGQGEEDAWYQTMADIEDLVIEGG